MNILILVTLSGVLSAGVVTAKDSDGVSLVTDPDSNHITGVEGEPFNISCEGAGGHCSKFSAMKWTGFDGKEITAAQRNPKTTLIGNRLYLIFSIPKLKDSGPYKCSAVYDGKQELERQVFIEFYAQERIRGRKPKFQSSTFNASVDQGLNVRFLCNAESKLPLTYEWFSQTGDKISTDSRKRIFVSNSTSSSILTIKAVQQKNDEGQYICIAKNLNGLETKFYNLEVLTDQGNLTDEGNLTDKDAVGVRMITQPAGPFVVGLEGKPVVVSCEGAGGDKNKFSDPKRKTIDGEEILDGDPSVSKSQGKAVLTFMNPRINDSTSYLCTAVYDNEVEIQYDVFLEIHGRKPEFQSSTFNVSVDQGLNVRLLCTAESNLLLTYDWFNQTGDKVSTDSRKRIFVSNSTNSSILTIKGVQQEKDEGQYICMAMNMNGLETKFYYLEVLTDQGNLTDGGNLTDKDAVGVRMITQPAGPFVIGLEGKPIVVSCEGAGGDKNKFSNVDWKTIDGEEILDGDPSVSKSQGKAVLTFMNPRINASTSYLCTAVYDNEVEIQYDVFLEIHGHKPEFPFYSQDIVADEGGWLRVPCKAQGERPIMYNWYNQSLDKITEFMNSTIYATHSDDQSFLTFTDVSMEDKGRYTCSASNIYGQVSKVYKLWVLNSTGMKPEFQESFENVTAEAGKQLGLQCLAMGERPITYNWYNQEEDEISEDDRSSVFSVSGEKYSILNFQRLSVAHQGTYTCTASNAHGLASKVFLLGVVNQDYEKDPDPYTD